MATRHVAGAPMPRDVAGVSRALLEHAATTPYHFEQLWTALSELLLPLFAPPYAREVDTPQKLIDTLAQAQLLVYHAVAHPCVGVPAPAPWRVRGNSGRYSDNACAMAALQERLEMQCRRHLERHVVPAMALGVQAFMPHMSGYNVNIDGGGDDDDTPAVHAALQLLLCHVRCWRLYSVTVIQLQAVFAPIATTWRALGFSETALQRTETIALQQWVVVVLTHVVCAAMAHAVQCVLHRIRHDNIAAEDDDDAASRDMDGDDARDAAAATHARMCGLLAELKDELLMLPDHTHYEAIVEHACLLNVRAYYASTLQRVVIGSSNDSDSSSVSVAAYARQCLRAIDRERTFAAHFLKPRSYVVANVVHMLVDERLDMLRAAGLEQLLRVPLPPRDNDDDDDDDTDASVAADAHVVYKLFVLSPHAALPLLLHGFAEHTQRATASALRTAMAAAVTTASSSQQQHAVVMCDAVIRRLIALVAAVKRHIDDVFDGDARFVQQMEDGLLRGVQLALRERGVDARVLGQQLAVFAHARLRECAAVDNDSNHEDDDSDDNDDSDDDVHTRAARRRGDGVVDDVAAVHFFLPRLCADAEDAFVHAHRRCLATRLLTGGRYDAAVERSLLERIALTHTSALLFYCRSMLQAATTGKLYVTCSNDDDDDSRDDVAMCVRVLPAHIWPTHEHGASPPLTTMSSSSLQLPRALQQRVAAAQAMCATRRPHHHLALSSMYTTATIVLQPSWWLRHAAHADAAATATAAMTTTTTHAQQRQGRRVRVRVSLTQLCIVYALARRASWRLDALCAEVRVSASACVVSLQPLLRARLVVVDGDKMSITSVVRRGSDSADNGDAADDDALLDLVPDVLADGGASSSAPAALSMCHDMLDGSRSVDATAAAAMHDDEGACSSDKDADVLHMRRVMEANVVAVLKREGALTLPALQHRLDRVRTTPWPHTRTLKLCLDRLCERGLVARADDAFAFVP